MINDEVPGKNEPIYVGTPALVFMPPKNYSFKIIKKEHKVVLPRQGDYYSLDKDFFKESDGEFNIYDENSKTLFLPSITKVMFATKTYPGLDSNQLFVPIAIIFNDDTVEILGQVIEMITND